MLAKRVQLVRKKRGLTQKQLADLLGVTDAAVGMWERGRRQPNPQMLSRMAEILQTSTDYLLARTDREVNLDKRPLEPEESCPFHVAEGGIPYEALDGESPGEWFSMRVRDDSMAGARILKGDLVTVARQDHIEEASIMLVEIDSKGPCLRRVCSLDNGVVLIAENPSVSPVVTGKKNVRVIGRAVTVQFRVERPTSKTKGGFAEE